ncbi:MAG: PEP-CTERM sorting domain-containing protein [Bryobacteraceae bacterium]
MKILLKAMIGGALLLGSGVCAMADTLWTLDDVFFNNGNEATGWFITDPTSTIIESFDITVSGADSADAFTAANMPDTYLANTPPEIGIANSDWSEYVDVYLASPLTSAGGTIDLTGGYDCPGCGVLNVDSDFRPRVIGSAVTPEPSTVPFLGAGLALLALAARRKLTRAS